MFRIKIQGSNSGNLISSNSQVEFNIRTSVAIFSGLGPVNLKLPVWHSPMPGLQDRGSRSQYRHWLQAPAQPTQHQLESNSDLNAEPDNADNSLTLRQDVDHISAAWAQFKLSVWHLPFANAWPAGPQPQPGSGKSESIRSALLRAGYILAVGAGLQETDL